jgi:carbon-monoxide dehydrogenase medium subunit
VLELYNKYSEIFGSIRVILSLRRIVISMRVLKPFEYLEPETVEGALRVLSTHGGKGKVLAGGIDLVPSLRRGEIKPEYVVSIQRVSGLNYIEGGGAQSLRIGALTSLRSLELSPIIQKDYPVLYEAVHQIASVQVKTMGTAVGNLCVATPASDVAAALFVLDAKLKIASVSSERTLPIEDFFIGLNQTILMPDQIVTEVLLPRPPAGKSSAFFKLVRTATDIAKVNVAVMITIIDNTCHEARIALGSVAPMVIRAKKAEGMLKGQKLESEVIGAAAEKAATEIKPITDIRSTAEYRQEISRVLVRRTIEEAVDRAKA